MGGLPPEGRKQPMMGRQEFAPKLYYQLSLDDLVPQSHLLRQIAEAIDFSFIYPLARPYYSHTGQPSVDPAVIFKALLIGYLYGITSERRLMSEVQVNLAYRWFLGYDLDAAIPDHSVLSKARSRFGMEVFEKFFERSIEICRGAGLMSEGPVYVDTTLVQAAASLDSLRQKDEVISPPLSIPDYVQRLYTENETPREEEALQPSVDQNSIPEPDSPSRCSKRRGGNANNARMSRTDPEATLVSRNGFGLRLTYKAHIAVSGKEGQVITAALATTGARADEHLLKAVLEDHSRYAGLPVRKVVADAKYATMANYVFLDETGVEAFIPPRRRVYEPGGRWGIERFRYMKEKDEFVCPAGNPMKPFTRRPSNQRISYRTDPGTCGDCQFKKQCKPSDRDRTVSRLFNQELVDSAKERVSSSGGRELLNQRKTRAEGVFGLAKELHGLRRTRFRGRRKFQIQLWLTAAVMNIKKAVRELGGKQPMSKNTPPHNPHFPLQPSMIFSV